MALKYDRVFVSKDIGAIPKPMDGGLFVAKTSKVRIDNIPITKQAPTTAMVDICLPAENTLLAIADAILMTENIKLAGYFEEGT